MDLSNSLVSFEQLCTDSAPKITLLFNKMSKELCKDTVKIVRICWFGQNTSISWPNAFGHIQGRDFLTTLFLTFFRLLLLLLQRIQPLANDHPKDPASSRWLSEGAGLLQMIIRRDHTLANNDPDRPASCKWSSRGASLMQMLIRRGWPLANAHPEALASCKWSSGGTVHLQMIIQRIWLLTNDHLKGPASCKWSSITPVTLVTSARIQIQSRGPF